ncbi:hypothetical protein GWI33_005909 [Rhynchophorus ferrugineus]|uniref:Uncharacterized protein n=1 Tax=Rhynchophorus ferrugineus TaxID=354439 RepID=A0A834J011_RHYFE|nr:hypothetical protein GWI33_005909 [Rhynchophorus ferrugineus]
MYSEGSADILPVITLHAFVPSLFPPLWSPWKRSMVAVFMFPTINNRTAGAVTEIKIRIRCQEGDKTQTLRRNPLGYYGAMIKETSAPKKGEIVCPSSRRFFLFEKSGSERFELINWRRV